MADFSSFVSEQWSLFLALAVILALLIRAHLGAKLSGVKELNTTEAVKLLNDDDTLILDVRTDNEYGEGHIRNSKHIPLGVLANRLGELESHRDSKILLVCRSGNRSRMASKILAKQGFQSTFNLGGGIMAWSNANLPLSRKKGK